MDVFVDDRLFVVIFFVSGICVFWLCFKHLICLFPAVQRHSNILGKNNIFTEISNFVQNSGSKINWVKNKLGRKYIGSQINWAKIGSKN